MEKFNLDGINRGSPVSQCPTCDRVFSTVANFDKHRKDGRCIYPEDVGLSLNEKGIWRTPMSNNDAKRLKSIRDKA